MENRYNKTKSLVEAGLLSALIVIIMLLNVYVPIFSAVGTFILPIPVTLLYIRYNNKVTLSAIVVSALLVGTLYNPLSAISSAISYGLIGITLGYCIKNDVKISITLLYLTAVSVISMIVNAMIIIFFIHRTTVFGMIKDYINLMKESMKMTTDIYGKLGVDPQQAETVLKAWEIFTPEYVATLVPAILLLAGFTSGLINYVVTKAILKKMRYNVRELTSIDRFYVDNRIGALFIILICLGIILNARNFPIGKYIINSTFTTLQIVLLIDGIAVAIYYLKKRFNVSRRLLTVIILFSMITPLSMTFVYLGIGDMIFDFRKLDPNRMFGRRKS